MVSSTFIPISGPLSALSEVECIIFMAFDELGLRRPRISLDNSHSRSAALLDGFVMVDGGEKESQCWISISECSPCISGDPGSDMLVDVMTRGDWLYPAIIAYAFCRHRGRVVFNDAGVLGKIDTYSADSLKEAIIRKIHS